MNRFCIILILLLYVGSLFPRDFFTRGRVIDIPSFVINVLSFVPNDTSPPLSNTVGATLAVARKGEATKNISNDITIYNIRGQLIKRSNDFQTIDGENVFVWNRRDNNNQEVASGVYFFRVKSNEQIHTGKLLILK